MSTLNTSAFSDAFAVRRMSTADIPVIYAMTSRNTQYYAFCGRKNTADDIRDDLCALPPGKSLDDKYYVGFFDGHTLVAVMDLIDGYPDADTAYIGFFMMNADLQGRGIGSSIISGVCDYLGKTGFRRVRLAFDKDNPQSTHFWHKNNFTDLRDVPHDGGIVVLAERALA
ncbi:MAG: GNAT family N-acetyltransferase [Clostridia bacterium]|nr:GNAT family N-acetyltransferase [Clostridia bacterium]